ncbi:helix-turn-helix domain-containing protein [Methylococcus mesophilus]|uniref:helix-turn-helix domain-containing protein n=1 Tax=Methylococcus mesophilus TaxID=2993564 RepID=UPI00224B99AD|nr:helix-turn-helix domain-containing protein [Methylococcus mesophilus]UZR30635.1 helix-turn-helix domain-containing protein [Methylococcus mesophilus]
MKHDPNLSSSAAHQNIPSLDALPDSALLSPEQTGEILYVKPSTLAVWRCTGRVKLPFVKIGKFVKYRAGDIRAFIAANAHLHTGAATESGGPA